MSGGQLRVLRATPLIQLHDLGRFGVRHLGLSQGGALDWIAAHQANALLGNPPGAPLIEVPLGGLELQLESATTLALTGADLDARLDGQPIAPGQSLAVRAGQRLLLRQPRDGARACIAVPGGFVVPALLGSCSAIAREGCGGLHGDGRALQPGDTLRWHGSAPAPRQLGWQRRFDGPIRLDLIPGAQYASFSPSSLRALFEQPWTLDARSDRMGMRLRGPQLECHHPPLVSEGICLGAVQVPPDGQPIILLNDRQTIGGYPRLGALTPLAIARLAQCLPGQPLHIRPILLETAQRQMRGWMRGWD